MHRSDLSRTFFLLLLLLVIPGRRVQAQSTATPDSGTVVASDNFDDPRRGILTSGSSNPAYLFGYVGGEYQIAKIDAGYVASTIPAVSIPGTFADVSIAVDARLVGDTALLRVSVYCRASSTNSFYRLDVVPSAGTFGIWRSAAGGGRYLYGPERTSALSAGNATNHLLLTCIGTTISGSINGAPVASVQDTSLQAGGITIGAGPLDASTMRIASDARFDNLVVTSFDASGNTASPSISAATPPSAPGNLTGVPLDSTRVELDWTESDGAMTYEIFDATTGAFIKAVPAGTATYTLVNLAGASEYCAIVYAVNSTGRSAPSNQVCATTPS